MRLISKEDLVKDVLIQIFDALPDAVMIINLDGEVIECNKAALGLSGYSSHSELIGKKAIELIDETEREKLRADIAESREKGIRKNLEYTVIRKDGVKVPVRVSQKMLLDKSGKPIGFISTLRDISEEKNAQEEVRRLTYKLDGIKPGVCYLFFSHDDAFKIYRRLVLSKASGLCIVRENPQILIDGYGVDPKNIVVLSSRKVRDFKTIYGLQDVARLISKHLKNQGSVIVLDGIEYLTTHFGFESVFKMLQEKRFQVFESKASLFIPIQLETLSKKENALLQSEIELYEKTSKKKMPRTRSVSKKFLNCSRA